ncbi:MAG: hypothetical protein J6A25_12855 [Lachnospiraceae bacterium]|nr:hypothetical protein [Lachnospiraceae bacterium]
MYLKQTFKEIKNNWFMNSIIIIQMVVVFACTMCATSVVSYFYNYYNNFSDYYKQKGDVYRFESVICDSIAIENSDMLENELSKTDIISMYMPWAVYYDLQGNELQYFTFAYDEEIIDAFRPKLKEGRWINPNRNDGIIEAVILDSEYDLSVGMRIDMRDVYMLQPNNGLTVEIVGIIEDGTRIVGISSSGNGQLYDYRNVYMDYYIDNEELPVILTSIDSINVAMDMEDNHSLQRSMSGLMFATYENDITDSEIAANERVLGSVVRNYSKISMTTIKENSIKSIKERLYSLLPVFLCVFILVLITGMCNFAISVKKHMRDYTIFSVCGMPWNKSAYICVIKATLMCLIAFIISIAGIWIMLKKDIIKDTTIELGFFPVVSCVVVGGLYVLLSSIMPFALINGTSLNSELKSNI